MARNITTGYFGLINNCFLRTVKDKLYIVHNGVFYIRNELILDPVLRDSTEKELETLLHHEYRRYLMINALLTGVLSALSFYLLSHFLAVWVNFLVTGVITLVVMFSRRQFIEEWKLRLRSIIVFMFDYLELLSLYNQQNVEFNQVAQNTDYLHAMVTELKDNYNDLLKYLKVNHPRIFENHARDVQKRKTTKNVNILDYTDDKYRC